MVSPARRRRTGGSLAVAAALACAALLAGCGAQAPGDAGLPTAASAAPTATPLVREAPGGASAGSAVATAPPTAQAPGVASGAGPSGGDAGAASVSVAPVAPGAVAGGGGVSPVAVPVAPAAAVSAAPVQAVAAAAKRVPLVCVDPGHQRKANNEQEPEGPGSEVTKAKVAGGTIGVSTRKPEYELTLEVSLKLRDVLQELGYNVLMIRETNEVDISNKERSLVCNHAGADIAIRIHADGSDLPSVKGLTVLYPSAGDIAAPSKNMANAMLRELIAATDAKSRGIVPRNDLSGFNWSTVPSLLVEMGFMTNKDEDKLMSTDEYQDKLVGGMASFIQHTFPL